MELKCNNRFRCSDETDSFNRTFMELKYRLYYRIGKRLPKVLIVPLWNWNRQGSLLLHHPSWVLIVPLWNWNPIVAALLRTLIISFNRTFMELKFEFCRFCPYASAVLIVPLWNWNLLDESLGIEAASFNRTFMELKFWRYSKWGNTIF